MLTLFTTAKPFTGHNAIIQRNALTSWKLLRPEVEVILFGDDEGAAEVCADLDLRHEPHVERHPSGMKYLNYLFERAQAIARYDYLCYSNCDIILLADFCDAFAAAARWRRRFLMIGQRWDADITEPIDFTEPEWASTLRILAQTTGFRQAMHFIDYFAFYKGVYYQIPPFVLGRSWWDHWLVWSALSRHVPVIDCSSAVLAIHQNHSYTYHPQGKQGTHEDGLAQLNRSLAGNGKQLCITPDSTHALTARGHIRRAPPFRRFIVWTLPNLMKSLIFRTFWLRKPLGLQRKNFSRLAKKLRLRVRRAP